MQGATIDTLPPRVGSEEGLWDHILVPGKAVGGPMRGMGLSMALNGPGRGLHGAGGATGGPGDTSRAVAMPPPGLTMDREQPQGSVPSESTLHHLQPLLHLSCLNVMACKVDQCVAACKHANKI